MNKDYLTRTYGIFEVRGAAGAGKTYQLCQDMELLSSAGKKGIVISFSNTAVNELIERSSSRLNVTVRTIHSFCWYLLSSIRMSLLNSEKLKDTFVPEAFSDLNLKARMLQVSFDPQSVSDIVYGDNENTYPFYDKKSKVLGLSHDDVLNLFVLAMDKFPSLSRLISQSVDFILIDEYQDTDIDFLRRIFKCLSSNVLIGIYGDPLQSVYSGEQSRIDESKYTIRRLVLPENHRSRETIVDFLNELRLPFDGLRQDSKLDGGSVGVVVCDRPLDARISRELEQKYHLISENSMLLSLTNYYKVNTFDFGKIADYIRKTVLYKLTGSNGHQWAEVVNPLRLNSRLKMLISCLELEFSSGYEVAQTFSNMFTVESISFVGMEEISKKFNSREAETTPFQIFREIGLKCNTGWERVVGVAEGLQPDLGERKISCVNA